MSGRILSGLVKCLAYWPLLLIHGVIASCEQRVGHKRKRVPSPACVLAVSMSDNA